jgi:hypothetical protein
VLSFSQKNYKKSKSVRLGISEPDALYNEIVRLFKKPRYPPKDVYTSSGRRWQSLTVYEASARQICGRSLAFSPNLI